MTRRRPSDGELESMLREGHFGESAELAPADPVEPTPMRLAIDQIEGYERNPRTQRNPLYDEIKDSIRHQGLQQPLVITRRPGAARYMVKAGGNTRLKVLNDLHRETGDARFANVHCLFEPWSSESDVLAAHLIENDTRGALSFIDKAQAVRALKILLESETGETLTQERLASALRARGYRLERSLLSRMDYAVDILLPQIPEALRAGLGQPQIQRIRRLERAVRQIWLAQEIGSDADFEQAFEILLARYDGVEWQLDRLRRALEKEIAERMGEELPRISLELDAVLGGHSPNQRHRGSGSETIEPPSPVTVALDAVAHVSEPSSPVSADSARSHPTSSGTRLDAPHVETRVPDASTSAEPPALPDENHTDVVAKAVTAVGNDSAGAAPIISDPKSLRARTWVLASRLAKRSAMGEIVVPLGNHGAGFLVDFVFTGEDDDAQTKLARATLWWFLASVAEQFHGSAELVTKRLPEGWSEKPIGQIISDPDAGEHMDLLAEYALIGFGPLMGPLVFARMDDRDWADLIDLLNAYRQLKRSVAAADGNLWASAP